MERADHDRSAQAAPATAGTLDITEQAPVKPAAGTDPGGPPGPPFRRRWLPKALPAEEALDRLASWQRSTYKLFKIHYAFIAICKWRERRRSLEALGRLTDWQLRDLGFTAPT